MGAWAVVDGGASFFRGRSAHDDARQVERDLDALICPPVEFATGCVGARPRGEADTYHLRAGSTPVLVLRKTPVGRGRDTGTIDATRRDATGRGGAGEGHGAMRGGLVRSVVGAAVAGLEVAVLAACTSGASVQSTKPVPSTTDDSSPTPSMAAPTSRAAHEAAAIEEARAGVLSQENVMSKDAPGEQASPWPR